ncbi:MAG: hypothetical protein AAB922_04815 [Patescibacteria group bacterium]
MNRDSDTQIQLKVEIAISPLPSLDNATSQLSLAGYGYLCGGESAMKCYNLELEADELVCVITGKATACNGDADKCTTAEHPDLTDYKEEAR